MSAFAEVADLEDQWRSLDEREAARAEPLLSMAAVLIRRHVTIEDGSPDEKTAKQVSLEMVRAAMIPGDYQGMSSYSDTSGDVVESATLLNPAATLRFTRAQKELFGVGPSLKPRFSFGDQRGGCRV